ncbi:non-hydrolyzing UDP-N-acetylglucosamine 2-epimerase [Wenyingzhuangia marina]|uniref:UDP-N-acetylglucosamine 2-epimerase (non-hydrolyzing) n=1 Tax=Wenyingzhuangia marina TaxID=1195760 RepID=A0A1M5X222_9FLAO|nr:UDP-N-acetylglucosamine 2-epimerase (non-hydrolyzing) [Wenyingzhuangia marina]GGF60918.1 UDP-N-acetyl glucosamine 2-epimerase [Wenyingzhuangia marina]SHH93588.1 UDP-N-acetylglucosamine 2-epimerase (non-hydrolysing) [Wenyingzhuangia marina]
MKKILLVFGTRPEAIKMAPLVKEFQKYPQHFQPLVCVTGQHREMLDQVLALFKIIPEYDLNIMKPGQDLYDITSRVLLGMKEVLANSTPDMVLVHGDTTTSMAASLAAFYQRIDIGHVEAGLRTNDIYSPWPEEINRQLTGRLAKFHFAPTKLSKENLQKEGVLESFISVTGNTVIDALYNIIEMMKNDDETSTEVEKLIESVGYLNIKGENRKRVLITGHRRENFGEGFLNICQAIKQLLLKYPQVDFIYPMHLNPNVRKPIKEVFKEATPKNVYFIEPLDYLPFVYLLNKSDIVLTDSGGIQEEAPGLGKPVLVMRNTTERPEALAAGTVKLVGTDIEKIIYEVSKLIENEEYYTQMSKAQNPYGDGKACQRIVSFIGKRIVGNDKN